MAITYDESAKLMSDPVFVGRTRIACLHFAAYIDDEDVTVPSHNTRMRWAQATYQNADASVAQIMPVMIMDDKVQTAGSAITDADLQSALESSVNKMF